MPIQAAATTPKRDTKADTVFSAFHTNVPRKMNSTPMLLRITVAVTRLKIGKIDEKSRPLL